MADSTLQIKSNLSLVGLDGVTLTSPTAGQVLTFDGTSWVNQDAAGSGDVEIITQTAHGFSIGNAVYHNGTSYLQADTSSEATAEVIGIVSAIVSGSEFEITYNGRINGFTGLTSGAVYYLQNDGSLAVTEGSISKPILVATSDTSGIFINYRGSVGASGTGGGGGAVGDADTLDGLNSTSFVRSDANDTITSQITFNNTNPIVFNSGNADQRLWEIMGDAGFDYAFYLDYKGSGTGNDNQLELWSHNQAGTDVKVYEVKQDGYFRVTTGLVLPVV